MTKLKPGDYVQNKEGQIARIETLHPLTLRLTLDLPTDEQTPVLLSSQVSTSTEELRLVVPSEYVKRAARIQNPN